MGFKSVTFGLSIGHEFNFEKFIKIICSEYTLIEYEPEEYEIEFAIVKVTLWDDIKCKHGQKFEISVEDLFATTFTYLPNPDIKIGYTGLSSFMIYVGNIADCSYGGKYGPTTIKEKTMTDLLEWKQKLIKQDRLDKNTKLQLVGEYLS